MQADNCRATRSTKKRWYHTIVNIYDQWKRRAMIRRAASAFDRSDSLRDSANFSVCSCQQTCVARVRFIWAYLSHNCAIILIRSGVAQHKQHRTISWTRTATEFRFLSRSLQPGAVVNGFRNSGFEIEIRWILLQTARRRNIVEIGRDQGSQIAFNCGAAVKPVCNRNK